MAIFNAIQPFPSQNDPTMCPRCRWSHHHPKIWCFQKQLVSILNFDRDFPLQNLESPQNGFEGLQQVTGISSYVPGRVEIKSSLVCHIRWSRLNRHGPRGNHNFQHPVSSCCCPVQLFSKIVPVLPRNYRECQGRGYPNDALKNRLSCLGLINYRGCSPVS